MNSRFRVSYDSLHVTVLAREPPRAVKTAP